MHKELLLSELPLHKSAIVTTIDRSNPKVLPKVLALGIFPGQLITLCRNYPEYVIALDNTLIGLDHNIANHIRVKLT